MSNKLLNKSLKEFLKKSEEAYIFQPSYSDAYHDIDERSRLFMEGVMQYEEKADLPDTLEEFGESLPGDGHMTEVYITEMLDVMLKHGFATHMRDLLLFLIEHFGPKCVEKYALVYGYIQSLSGSGEGDRMEEESLRLMQMPGAELEAAAGLMYCMRMQGKMEQAIALFLRYADDEELDLECNEDSCRLYMEAQYNAEILRDEDTLNYVTTELEMFLMGLNDGDPFEVDDDYDIDFDDDDYDDDSFMEDEVERVLLDSIKDDPRMLELLEMLTEKMKENAKGYLDRTDPDDEDDDDDDGDPTLYN